MNATQHISTETVPCPVCGGTAILERYSGSYTAWTDEIDSYGYQAQRTYQMSEGFSIECESCDYADAEPPQA